MSKFITSFNVDIAKWYTDILTKAELIDYGPSKGSVILKPYSFAIWKNIQKILTKYFEQDEIEELYLPLLIPYSYLEKEKEHIEGFAPEVFTITKIGNKNVEPLVIRPTSETLFAKYFKDNLQSYKQLPMKLNQWVNVMRGEKNTRPFLRTSEFLWQEGHTLHETEEEAYKYSKKILSLYKLFYNKHLDMFVLDGEKTINERFAGAKNTYTIETILRDGKALQSATSHFLGTTFATSFDVKFQSKEQKSIYPNQTSWGVSTRSIGAIIMSHSDDEGLVLPWDVAPFHVVILTFNPHGDQEISQKASELFKTLKAYGLRVKMDDSEKGMGFKSSEWEIKGVPMRIELGKRDIEQNQVIIVDRSKNSKNPVSLDLLTKDFFKEFKTEYKNNLFEKTKANTLKFITKVDSMEELKEVIDNDKVAKVYWKEDTAFEIELQEKIEGATIRMLEKTSTLGKCVHSGEMVNTIAIIAKVY